MEIRGAFGQGPEAPETYCVMTKVEVLDQISHIGLKSKWFQPAV